MKYIKQRMYFLLPWATSTLCLVIYLDLRATLNQKLDLNIHVEDKI